LYFQSDDEKYRILAALSLKALYVLLASNLAIVLLGYFLAQSKAGGGNMPNSFIRNVIFFVAVAEMIAIHFIKKTMLANTIKALESTEKPGNIRLQKELLNITIVIASICSAISIYGLILVILGEKFEILLLFVAMSLISYQFFRLRPKDFQEGQQ
jgi:hypothetical protein